MASGFAHFDSSHRENFCAAVLLLAMEVDDAVSGIVARLVRNELAIESSSQLLGFGREARLAETDDDNYARVDLWLLFGSPAGPVYAFIELKTHDRWDGAHVERQVRDQAGRRLATTALPIVGSVLLAPERLVQRVRGVPAIAWTTLLRELRALGSSQRLTGLAIQHLEETMDRPAGLDRPMTLNDFEHATTLVGCLRAFLRDCIADVGGRVHGEPMYITAGDGRPRRGSGWAWHGLSVPFARGAQKGRIGIYKYAEAPPGEEAAKERLWLEAYLGEGDTPVAFVEFAPPTLAAIELESVRGAFKTEWTRRVPQLREGASTA